MNCTTLISHIRISKFVYIHGNVFHEKLDYRAHSIQFHPVVKLEITARSWITMIGPVPRIDPRRSVAWPVARSVKGNTSADFFRPFNALVYFSASAMSRITFRIRLVCRSVSGSWILCRNWEFFFRKIINFRRRYRELLNKIFHEVYLCVKIESYESSLVN